MVARSQQAARLKLAMAAGGGTLLIFLAVLGGVVGWFSVSSPEQLQHPEVRANHWVPMALSLYFKLNFSELTDTSREKKFATRLSWPFSASSVAAPNLATPQLRIEIINY